MSQKASSYNMLSQEQQEIVDLLRHELEELTITNTDSLQCGIFEKQKELFYEYNIHLEHLANALELAGLGGLSFCTKRLALIFKTLLNEEKAAPISIAYPLSNWGIYFIAYLDNLGDSNNEEIQIKQLLEFLSQKELPESFNESDIAQAKELFNISDLSVIDEEQAQLPHTVDEEMCSLNIEKDVHPDLLQGMLIELPEQTLQFERSISHFLASGDFNDLQQAQRVAHTIKGAANVVSIHGMANLTHFAEDVLETASKNLSKAPAGFDDVLVRTSDCLATTAEFLNKQGPAPDDLNEVMQLLLDWLNRLKSSDADISETKTIETGKLEERAAEKPQNKNNTEVNTVQAGQQKQVAHESSPDGKVTPLITPLTSTETTEFKEKPKQAQASATTPSIPTESTSARQAAQKEEAKEAADTHADTDRYINLHERVAQELLRLSGEMQISNNQLSSQVGSIESSLESTNRFHKQIKLMATELEALVQTQSALRSASMKYSDNEIDPLEMERFSELHTFSNRLHELTTDSYETITNIDQQVKELSALAHSQRQLNKDNQQILLEMNLVPVGSLSSRFKRCVRQTSRLTGKEAELTIQGEELLLDSRVLNRIADPIMHLLRNAIDHGLERDRAAKKKPAQGDINLIFANKGDTIEIICKDDGKGLNYDRIKNTAVMRGLLDNDTPANDALLNKLILMPGFSTRDVATQTSGRGIGLDSVIAEVRGLKGNMTITSERGQGCVVTISVPTSILTSHGLLVECRDRNTKRTYGIAARGIQQVIYIDQEELVEHNNHLAYKYQDDYIPVHTLGELLNTISLEEESISVLLISTKSDGSLLAIGVEKVSASQELVIKPLNRFSYPAPGVIGATILGDGTASPVIDIQDLPGIELSEEDMTMMSEQRARAILAEKANFIAPPAALVVDDSLSARRSLAQFVSDMGMDVYTAKDGFDAINVIHEKKPSLMLVDLEMPRMNGLELTAHIRSREEYRDIPVIMITSRSTRQHQDMARDAGVNTYLTKPWSDDELLSSIQKEIA